MPCWPSRRRRARERRRTTNRITSMDDPQKKSTAPFWATVVVVVVLLYALSMGPATWLNERHVLSDAVITALYAPVFKTYEYGGASIRRAIDWYLVFWSKKSGDGIIYDEI